MMTSIKRTLRLELPARQAFHKFVNEFGKWWPKEYTWSRDKLQSIGIDAHKNGLCTEIGPYGFRCDWGRVVAIDIPHRIVFKWQISPQRVPEPNPSQASEVEVQFKEKDDGHTELYFEHRDFDKHGDGAEAYQQAMDSEMGWDYILSLFVKHCKGKLREKS